MVTNEQIQQLFQKVKNNVNLEEKIINEFDINKKTIKLKDETLGSINRIEISDSVTSILNKNEVSTLGDLCNKTKTDLKKLEIHQEEINKMDIELQLLGLRLKNSL